MLLGLIGGRRIPKDCVLLGIYRVEETKGLIDRMRIIGLPGANDHNGSIEDHIV